MIDSNRNEPSKDLSWEQIGTENAYAALDIYINTTATNDSDYYYWFRGTRVDYTAILNCNAIEVDVDIYIDNAGDEKHYKKYRADVDISNWGDYFYGDIEVSGVNFFIPTAAATYDEKITIKKDSSSNDKLFTGKILVGYAYELGVSVFGATGSIVDYSKIKTDKLGNIYIEQGNYAKEMHGYVYVETCKIDAVFRALAAVRGEPTLYLSSAEDKFNTMNIYGYYKDFDLIAQNAKLSKCSLRLQGIM